MSVLVSWVRSDDVEDHGEHNNEDEEEQHEHFEISHNTNDHSDDVTETFDYTHEEEGFEEANHSNDDHCDL
jgi:hypothetical protein